MNCSLKISSKCYVEKIISHLFFSVESKTSRSSSQGSSTGRKSEDRLTEAEEADGEDADSPEDVSIFEDDFHQKVFAKSPISFKGRRSNSKLRISLKNTVDQPSSVGDHPKSPRHHKSQPNPVCLNFWNSFQSSLVFVPEFELFFKIHFTVHLYLSRNLDYFFKFISQSLKISGFTTENDDFKISEIYAKFTLC